MASGRAPCCTTAWALRGGPGRGGAGGEDPHELWYSTWAAVELIEAASRTGELERRADALERLAETARAGGSDWALGVEARSRALLSDGDAAESLYREAIERLGAPACASTSPAPTSSTASGYAASAAA